MGEEVYKDPQWLQDNWKRCNIHIIRKKSNVEPLSNVGILCLIYSLNEGLMYSGIALDSN